MTTRPSGDHQLVLLAEEALRSAAQRAGAALACQPGCTECCHGAFAINTLDAARLQAGMEALQVSDPALSAAIRTRAEEWLATWEAGFPGNATTGVLGTSEADEERFADYANEPACPALDPASGRCQVYAHRPMTCRVFGPPVRNEGGALGHCELCFQGAPTALVASCEMVVPHELESALMAELKDDRSTVIAFVLAGRFC